ncbi:orotate phosphoribosyltransferase [Candidatus Peregrinibacteria bacterium]|nr:orotate phosphoribosyltransferase [Candidatus Peregrinibacteria bacterium]
MEQYKQEFVKFLVETQALQFGEFTLKSGRKAPYFFNIGSFCQGSAISKLSSYYAEAFLQSGFSADVIFGPAYKGIPLAVSLSITLFRDFQKNVSYAFNRKEAKTYGQKDTIVGASFSDKTRVVLVDDVVTAGTAIRESLEILKNNGNPQISGILIALDRMEKNNDGENALLSLSQDFHISIHAIITLDEVIEYLYGRSFDGHTYIDDERMEVIQNYRALYGIS